MRIQLAEMSDIDDILRLHYKYHLDSIGPEEKADGFVTTPFNRQQLEFLIREERGITVARSDTALAAYAMAASWSFWARWPMFVYMIENLPGLTLAGRHLTVTNSYQYGPVCIDGPFRGSGLLELLFEYSRRQMAPQYPFLVTFINKRNPRSFAAHTRKTGLEVVNEFSYNANEYYELAYDTSKPLSRA
jgi:hypothetical protein